MRIKIMGISKLGEFWDQLRSVGSNLLGRNGLVRARFDLPDLDL